MEESIQCFGCPKLLTRKKSVLSILVPNLQSTRINGPLKIFENGKTRERTRFAPLSQAQCSNVKTLA